MAPNCQLRVRSDPAQRRAWDKGRVQFILLHNFRCLGDSAVPTDRFVSTMFLVAETRPKFFRLALFPLRYFRRHKAWQKTWSRSAIEAAVEPRILEERGGTSSHTAYTE